jgi:hypothetical protein
MAASKSSWLNWILLAIDDDGAGGATDGLAGVRSATTVSGPAGSDAGGREVGAAGAQLATMSAEHATRRVKFVMDQVYRNSATE